MTSVKLRLSQVLLVVFINVFSTGIIFGFAALKPLLIRKGVYSWLCTNDDNGSGELGSCDQQELRLNDMFVIAVALTNMASLPAGFVLDSLGPTKTSIMGATLFGLGNLVFGSGYTSWPIVLDGYYIGFFLLAIGSPLIFLSSFHISNAFPPHSGLILSLIMAGFNASSTWYALFDWIDQRAGGVSIQAWFWCYTLIPVLFIMLQVVFGPAVAYQKHPVSKPNQVTTSSAPAVTYGATSNGDSSSRETGEAVTHPVIPRDPFVGIISGKPLIVQLFSRHFGLLLIFFSIYADRINWEIQTISEQLAFYLGDPDIVARTVTKFTVFLPIGGIVGVPVFGWLLDNRTTFDASVVILAAGLLYGMLGMVHSTIAQIASISVFVVLRPLLYIFVGDYCGKAFGFETFGRVYGLANTLVGLLSLILGPIDHLVKNQLHGNYNIVNAAWLILGFVAATLLSWSIRRGLTLRERDTSSGELH